MSGEPTVLRTLQGIVDLAVQTIDGCDGAGLLIVDCRAIVAGAWSDERVRQIEELECAVGVGPCVDAILERPTFESPDLRDEIARWPTFAARALEAGVESMLAFRLFAAGPTLGALELYSSRRGAFDEAARAFATVYAAHAALALSGAQVHERDLSVADNLRDALATRDVIGQAKGILMATRGVDADTAFGLLRTTSQHLNVKLRTVAARVVVEGDLPER